MNAALPAIAPGRWVAIRKESGGGMDTTRLPTAWRETTAEFAVGTIHRKAEASSRYSYLALRDVSCMACDDVVYLHGRLPSYFLKQVAQEIAAGVEGVRLVINRIDVRRQARARPESAIDRGPRCTRGERSPRAHQGRKEFTTMLVLTRKLNESIIVGDDSGSRSSASAAITYAWASRPPVRGIFREEILGRTEADDSRVMTGPFGLETRRVGP